MQIIRPPLPLAGEGTGEGGALNFPLTLILSPCRGRGGFWGCFQRNPNNPILKKVETPLLTPSLVRPEGAEHSFIEILIIIRRLGFDDFYLEAGTARL